MAETYGIVEAQRRYRAWMPHLTTNGQRVVYGAMLSYFGVDGTATPTAGQLSGLAGFTPRSVRRILGQLEEIGALMRVGDRPVVSGSGVAKGGRVVIWSIPLGLSEDLVGESQEDRERVPIGPRSTPNRSPEGHPLKVERLKENEVLKIDPSECDHAPTDDDGYCTKCGLDNVIATLSKGMAI